MKTALLLYICTAWNDTGCVSRDVWVEAERTGPAAVTWCETEKKDRQAIAPPNWAYDCDSQPAEQEEAVAAKTTLRF